MYLFDSSSFPMASSSGIHIGEAEERDRIGKIGWKGGHMINEQLL
jgi:hypothetical protein